MTNRVITILLILLTTVALVGEAARSIMAAEGQWREWLQLLVAQQVADTLDRQVQLGPITDISLEGVQASSLAVAEGYYLENGAVIRAERLRIAFDLAGILQQKVAPAAGISRVRVENAWVHAVRDPQGELNVQRLIPEPVGPPPPPEDRFQGVVTVVDSTIIYDDYAVDTVRGTPLNVELAGVNAEIDMRKIGWATFDVSAWEQLGRFGAVAAHGQAEIKSGFLWGTVEIGGLDAAYWFDTFVTTPDLAVQRGSVDVAASVGLMPQASGSPEPTVAADVRVRNAAVTLAALDGRQVVADATLTGTMDGAQIHSLDARMGATQIDATGFIGDWEEPVVDVAFDAEVADADELRELTPELDSETQAQVEAVALSGPVFITGTMVGPVERANLSAQVDAPGEIRYASTDVGEIVAGPLDLRLDVLDLTDPNVRGRANIARADPVDLEPLRASLPEEMDGPIEVAPLENVSADVLWSNEIPVAHTELAIPRVAVGDIAVADLRTGVALAGRVIYLRDLRAEPLGARLAADAAIDLGAEGGLWAWAEGRIDGLDLARLQELPGLESAEGLSGELSGEFAGEYVSGTPYVLANAVVDRPGYEDYGAESVRALVVVDEDAVEVRGAGVQDAVGTAWVRGVMPFEGEMAASFAVAGVDLETVNERFDLGVEGLRGEAFVTGSAGGTPEEPEIDAKVRAFNLAYQDYQVDAVLAEIDGGLDEVRVSNLFASSGRIVAQASGSLSEIDLEEQNAAIDATVTVAGPVDQNTLDLANLQDQDLVGAVNATVNVDGTLRQPGANGTVELPYARYDAVSTDNASLRVSLQGDVLQMEELEVPVRDAVVSGSATVTSLFDKPVVSAMVRAENLVLQDLALWQQVGLPLSGTVNLPYLSVQGPLDDLRGLGQIEATGLELENEQIGAISAAVVLEQNRLMLQRTTLALAGGELSMEGVYRLDRHEIDTSRAELADVSISELLQIGVPIARWAEDNAETDGTAGGESLARQLASMSLRLGGRLDGTVEVSGVIPEPAPPGAPPEESIRNVLAALEGRVNVDVHGPSFDNKSLPDTTLIATVAEEPEVALSVEASEGDALITTDGTWRPEGEIDLLAEISAYDLAQLRPWVPEVVEAVGGRLNLTVQASGTVDNPEFVGSIDITEPEAHGVKFDLVSAPIIKYDGEVLSVDSLVMRENEEEFYVTGRVPLDWDTRSVPADEEIEVTMTSDGTDLAIFPPLIADAVGEDEDGPLSQVKATGTLDSSVKIRGTARRPELDGTVEIAATSIQTPWLGSPVEDLALNLAFTGVEGTTRVDLQTFAARVESTTVEAGGTAEMTEYELATLDQNNYDFRLGVSAPRQKLGSDGLTLRKVRGEVTLDTNEETGRHLLTIGDLGADLGDGSILLSGTVDVASFDPAQFGQNDYDLHLVADDARPRYGNLFMGTLNGSIDVVNTPEAEEPVSVTGGMTLTHAIIGVPPMTGREAGPGLKGMPESFPKLGLKVALAIGPDVRVSTTGLTAPLEPTDTALTVTGTPQRPVLSGRVEVQEGETVISGGVLNVETAGVQYLLGPKRGLRREPPVDLELNGRVWATATKTIDQTTVGGRVLENVQIQMQVSGTLPDHIHVQVSSDPPLADEQIYAMLGTAPFSGGGLAEAGDLEDVMTEQFVAALGAAFRHYVFQPFQEDLKEILGLSVFEVSFAFDQPVDVRLGGYLIEDLLITYETSVYGATDTQYELGVSYKVERRFELTFETDEENDNRFLVEYVHQF